MEKERFDSISNSQNGDMSNGGVQILNERNRINYENYSSIILPYPCWLDSELVCGLVHYTEFNTQAYAVG